MRRWLVHNKRLKGLLLETLEVVNGLELNITLNNDLVRYPLDTLILREP